jgi:hypothetical protein
LARESALPWRLEGRELFRIVICLAGVGGREDTGSEALLKVDMRDNKDLEARLDLFKDHSEVVHDLPLEADFIGARREGAHNIPEVAIRQEAGDQGCKV